MEDKIKLHEICGYLPYGLNFISEMDKPYEEYGGQPKWTCIGITTIFKDYCFITRENNDAYSISLSKPLLRPLSDLTKEIEHNGERFVPIVKLLQEYCFDTNQMTEQEINEYAESMIEIDMSYMTAQMLMEWHFDIHGLIDRNLALNINDYEI